MTQGQQPEALCRLHAENASLTAGYDAARLEIKSLQAELVKESARTAAEKLRADQMTAQHRMQCEMGKSDRAKVQELESMLAAVGAGGVEPLRKADHLRDATQMVPADHLRGATKMTLDEAIEHAEEVAGCTGAQCGVEHAQLAAWLRELRDRRAAEMASPDHLRGATEMIGNQEAPAVHRNAHSTACLYQYALARLNLADSKEMRVIFWDANEALKWNPNTDSYLIPVIDDGCAMCESNRAQAQQGGA